MEDSVKSTTVLFYWDASAAGPVLGYKYVLDNSPSNPTISGTTTTDTFYRPTGLKPSTKYYFHIRAFCGPGDTAVWGTLPSITTLAPSQIENVNTQPENILCYPNPATDKMSIHVPNFVNGGAVSLTDMNGRLIQSTLVNNNDDVIDISALPKGVFIVRYISAADVLTTTIHKQ